MMKIQLITNRKPVKYTMNSNFSEKPKKNHEQIQPDLSNINKNQNKESRLGKKSEEP